MSQVDQLQNAEEAVEQNRQEADRAERAERSAELRREPFGDTATKAHEVVVAPLAKVKTMVNMRTGALPDIHELALSIKESGVLHPPLVRATGDEGQPYELLAGRRRHAAMALLDEAEGAREDWRFTLVDGISRREALTMQFAENFHQNKPEPVQFARAARAIMAEDDELTAADVSQLVGAPIAWTRKALRMLDLPESIIERVEQGDLSFTVADVVRRGIARGDVSEATAADLVEQHVEGEITTNSLKREVGYQPPKPKNYDELSRQLDEARWAGADAAAADRRDGAEQREWESSRAPAPTTGAAAAGLRGPARPDAAPAQAGGLRGDLDPEDVDGFLLGLILANAVPAQQASAMGVASEADAHAYAFSLRPEERLGVLRQLGLQLLMDSPEPPRALRSRLD
ncbi:ParB-like partition protein [Paraconexibacter sp. AEG42_29]|uniref:ParB-like partition protein n=1 Tax=Paraconexibacter sp. AEG42_29 TaxID=2997339 RepID=A0AAU7B3D3_9ACTN